MKQKFLSVLYLLAFLTGLLVLASPATADRPAEFPRNNMAPTGPYMVDGTHMLGERETALRKRAAQLGPAISTKASPTGFPATVGEELTITVADFGLGIDYDETQDIYLISDRNLSQQTGESKGLLIKYDYATNTMQSYFIHPWLIELSDVLVSSH